MRKVIVAISVLGLVGLVAWHTPAVPAKEGVQWMTLQQAEESYKKQQKPILIDLYTDWCGWCKVMDKETYANKEVAAYIMEKFYPVKLNAEQQQAIAYQGRTYQFNSKNRTHDFAIYLTGGRLVLSNHRDYSRKWKSPPANPRFSEAQGYRTYCKIFW